MTHITLHYILFLFNLHCKCLGEEGKSTAQLVNSATLPPPKKSTWVYDILVNLRDTYTYYLSKLSDRMQAIYKYGPNI